MATVARLMELVAMLEHRRIAPLLSDLVVPLLVEQLEVILERASNGVRVEPLGGSLFGGMTPPRSRVGRPRGWVPSAIEVPDEPVGRMGGNRRSRARTDKRTGTYAPEVIARRAATRRARERLKRLARREAAERAAMEAVVLEREGVDGVAVAGGCGGVGEVACGGEEEGGPPCDQ